MGKYRKKPVVVDAIQWTGDNELEVFYFLNDGLIDIKNRVVRIETLEGVMSASVGDYIIKGIKGEFYPCKPDIFEMTYEPV